MPLVFAVVKSVLDLFSCVVDTRSLTAFLVFLELPVSESVLPFVVEVGSFLRSPFGGLLVDFLFVLFVL